jgi:formylglycine-generating enzyme required for sulfatase activity
MTAAARSRSMAWIPGGTFWMGSEDFYPEERPVHQVRVDGFWMDKHPVTVAKFRRFVKATGYITTAQVPPPDTRMQTPCSSCRVRWCSRRLGARSRSTTSPAGGRSLPVPTGVTRKVPVAT